jgi:hypothetical protein
VSAWWPVLQQRLVELLPTLVDDDWLVFDGPAAGRESGKAKYILVGASTDGEGGSYDQPDDLVTTMRAEEGVVVVEVNSWTGDKAAPTRRAECFAVADALEAAIRTNQKLGVLPESSTTALSAEIVTPTKGTSARLVLSVNYTARS